MLIQKYKKNKGLKTSVFCSYSKTIFLGTSFKNVIDIIVLSASMYNGSNYYSQRHGKKLSKVLGHSHVCSVLGCENLAMVTWSMNLDEQKRGCHSSFEIEKI